MKILKFLLFSMMSVGSILNSFSQSFYQDNSIWEESWTNFAPETTDYPATTYTLPKMISQDTFLSNDKVYLISGKVHVAFGATLTIQEGTILRGDDKNPGSLYITDGSSLVAQGTATQPIVFTSNNTAANRKSGDWGGIVIVENEKVVQVANNVSIKEVAQNFADKKQCSALEFVRVEFAGNSDQNSISIHGMGVASNYQHIMVSYSDADSFGLYGGQGNLNNLISLKTNDDDYNISNGFEGELSSVLAIKHPSNIKSHESSFALEIDGGAEGRSLGNKKSKVAINNATFVNLSTKDMMSYTNSAISVANVAGIEIKNSLISGFSDVVEFDNSYTSSDLVENNFKMESSFFNIHGKGFKVSDPNINRLSILKYNTFTEDFMNPDQLFKDPLNAGSPKFQLNAAESMYTIMVPED